MSLPGMFVLNTKKFTSLYIHFPPLGPADTPRIANHSVLRFDMTYALFDK